MERDGFIDRSQRFSYLLACENARRIAADHSLLSLASEHLERFVRHDPQQRDGYSLWRTLLDGPCEAIVAILTERSAKADYARETAPVFPGLPVVVRTHLLRLARQPIPGAQPIADRDEDASHQPQANEIDRDEMPV